MAPEAVASPQNVKHLGALDFVYLFVGAPSQVLGYYENNVKAGWMANTNTLFFWHASLAPARKTERFRALVRANGMVEYWRAKGWPPQCLPTTGDDFECN